MRRGYFFIPLHKFGTGLCRAKTCKIFSGGSLKHKKVSHNFFPDSVKLLPRDFYAAVLGSIGHWVIGLAPWSKRKPRVSEAPGGWIESDDSKYILLNCSIT